MHQDLPLVSTIAVGLTLAFLLGLIASKLRLPPIVGYLLAGILIGPGTPGYVAHMDIANELAEIGIVLLMFGVGLHFSLKDLMDVKRIAVPGAIAQMLAATAMGSALASSWGWSLPAALFFGLALSVASTVVLLRSLEDHNLIDSTNGQIAIGWLIVEDLAMILALVLIPALAGESIYGEPLNKSPMMSLAIGIVKIGMFIIVMLVGGKRILPWLLKHVAKTRSRELFTLSVFAVAVGVAYGSSVLFDVSFALGAFFAGMMIRESDMNHEVADRALPFQDAFAVLFFVAVGMLFDPATLFERPMDVFCVVMIIIFGKSIVSFLIVLLFGYPLRTALLVSAGLAQIGEFSFILVAIGVMYGILPPEGRDLILAASLVSIGLNPVFFWSVRCIHSRAMKYPKVAALLDLREDNLSRLSRDAYNGLQKDLVIVVGYGQIGREVCDNILDHHIDLVIVDSNRERVEMLRELGYKAITGDARHATVLENAGLKKAAAVVIAVGDSFEARRIVDLARDLKEGIRVIIRAHNDEEVHYFRKKKVYYVTTPAREMGRSIIQYIEEIRSGTRPLHASDV